MVAGSNPACPTSFPPSSRFQLMDERVSELLSEVRLLRKIVWFSVALASVLAIELLERPLAAKITSDRLVLRQLSASSTPVASSG